MICLFGRRGGVFKDGSALIVGTFVAVSNFKGDGNPAPVRLHGFIISLFTAVPLTSVPTIATLVPLFLSFHEFSTREGGEVPPSSEACYGTESPDTKRRVPSLHL